MCDVTVLQKFELGKPYSQSIKDVFNERLQLFTVFYQYPSLLGQFIPSPQNYTI